MRVSSGMHRRRNDDWQTSALLRFFHNGDDWSFLSWLSCYDFGRLLMSESLKCHELKDILKQSPAFRRLYFLMSSKNCGSKSNQTPLLSSIQQELTVSWSLLLPVASKMQPLFRQTNVCAPNPFHTCFIPPMTFPLTWAQSILASNSSSTRPHTATFSPRMRYNPWVASSLGSGSSWGRITRSMVSPSTIFVNWSQDSKVPVRVRPSAVRMRTFSRKHPSGKGWV